MLQGKARVKEEVSYADPHVMVTVRHIPFNCDKSRTFKEGATMVEVYDWIVSLSPVPEYFEIVDYKGSLLPPDMEAQSGIYNMRKSSQPVNMTRSGILVFQGFSAAIEDDFEKLARLKNEKMNKLEDDEEFIVSRENIFQGMIDIYINRSITKSKNSHTVLRQNQFGRWSNS